jgi:hypothetical protein
VGALHRGHSLFVFWVAVRVNGGNHVIVTLKEPILNGVSSIGFSERQPFMSESDFTGTEFPSLNDVLQKHLAGCNICQSSLDMKPVPNLGGTPRLCSEWFEIISDYAQYEGEVNNVVARDEFGNEAPSPNHRYQSDNGLCGN